MLYGLHATAWVSIAKISHCGLWTISDNNYKLKGNFHWLFEILKDFNVSGKVKFDN